MVSISVIMSSARDDYSVVDLPNMHILQPTIDSLKGQVFKDFQFIFCDGLYNYRPNLFSGKDKGGIFDKEKFGFVVKHIPVEHNRLFNHSFWLDNRRWNICGQLNSCLIHAEGSLVVRIDDCCRFDSLYLKRFWDEYQTGMWLQAMHVRWLGEKPAYLNDEYRKKGYEMNIGGTSGGWDTVGRDELLRKLYGEDGLIRDSRYKKVVDSGGRLVAPNDWYYGYSSVPLDVALRVNGWDELFDADKSLEDSDMGNRLTMAGYSGKFLLDVKNQVVEYEHGPISNKVINSGIKPIKCNYAIYQLNKNKNRFRANSDVLSKHDIKFIKKESLKHPCSPNGVGGFYDENCNGRLFDIWSKNQGIFDLREERKLYGL